MRCSGQEIYRSDEDVDTFRCYPRKRRCVYTDTRHAKAAIAAGARKETLVYSSTHQPTVESQLPLRSWLLPYDRRTIVTPLDQAAVRAQLTAYLDRLSAAPTPGLFSYKVRYQGILVGDTLTLSGPIGGRRFRLETRGLVHSAPGGTAIELTLQLSTLHRLITVGQLAILWAWALIVGFPLVLILFLSGFGYVVTILSFRYEAAQIVGQLLSAARPQPQPGEQGAIVADNVGWRCGACGGYVREDATFCKHCKQPFTV
jgi:hypothetical protein